MTRLRLALTQFEGATTLRVLPLAAGLLSSTVARAKDCAIETRRIFRTRAPLDATAEELATYDVLGLSLYAWNERYSLEVARRAKARNENVLVIAGGPSVPRRPGEAEAFMASHPQLDVLVAGEGERVLVEIIRRVQSGQALDGVAGTSVRGRGGVTSTPRGARLAGDDFLDIGSPYLDGTFDELLSEPASSSIYAALLETNRGCPFACSFCDWGAATESRVHELPLDRVEAELRWTAERRLPYLYFIDANFGIRPRDVDIIRTLGRLKATHGAPCFVHFHVTKNATAKNLATVEALQDAGIQTQVSLSMQDFDRDVLAAISRANIPPERALALRERAHDRGLGTTNELLLGLPAQTLSSFRSSIVQAITPFPEDSFFLYPTHLLVNAEMSSPSYRERWGLVTRRVPSLPRDIGDDPHVAEEEEIVVGSNAMSMSEWREAFIFGFALSAIANQRLLATTLRVLRFALEVEVGGWIDALLGAPGPRMSACRAELGRYADAILSESGTLLPLDESQTVRRDAVEAFTARAICDWPAFCAEVADVTASFVPDHAALVREAVAWDAFILPERNCIALARAFDSNWLAYRSVRTRTLPAHQATTVSRVPPMWSVTPSAAAYLDALLASGWSKTPRMELVEVRG
jgi:hypothetical protein